MIEDASYSMKSCLMTLWCNDYLKSYVINIWSWFLDIWNLRILMCEFLFYIFWISWALKIKFYFLRLFTFIPSLCNSQNKRSDSWIIDMFELIIFISILTKVKTSKWVDMMFIQISVCIILWLWSCLSQMKRRQNYLLAVSQNRSNDARY